MKAARSWVTVYLIENGATLAEARQKWLDEYQHCHRLETFFRRIQRDVVRFENRKKLARRAQRA